MSALADGIRMPGTILQPTLSVSGLKKHFPLKGGLFGRSTATVRAVDGVTFDVAPGDTLGIVGESGCGKSTTARLLVDLIRPDDGTIRLDGKLVGGDLTIRDLRRQVQMVFQDSYASLNPRLTMEEAIAFGPKINGMAETKATQLAHSLLHRVGLEPRRFAGRYPHELSGGMRQRVTIALATICRPDFIIADEPTTALDVLVQKDVLGMIRSIQREIGSSVLFVTHDMGVHAHLTDRLAIMYAGRLAEEAPTREIFARPLHPYTKHLIASLPRIGDDTPRQALEGSPPSLADPPSGCRFHPRCPLAKDVCRERVPPMVEVLPEHRVACHAVGGSLAA